MTPAASRPTAEAGRGPPPEPRPEHLPRPLARAFYERPVEALAMALLGSRLVRHWPDGSLSSGRIVEVEAYGGPEDRASHARSGPTARNGTMFGPAGHAYVYRVYGIHTCLNVVAERPEGVGAVLVRAIMPETGVAALQRRRATAGRSSIDVSRLASGPGNVGAAFGIGLDFDGLDLTRGEGIWLEADATIAPADAGEGIVRGPRIGVGYAGPGWADLRRRFGLRDHPALSRRFLPEP